jgi:hypothetical protein
MPRDFFTDFVKVAHDEGQHFTLLAERLEELGSFYGALPAHDDLWDSATGTSNDLLARLAVEHCIHEVFFPYQLSYFKMNSFGPTWFKFFITTCITSESSPGGVKLYLLFRRI